MADVIATFPDQPSNRQTVELEGAVYQIEMNWRPRLRAWYFSLFGEDGARVALNRRLSVESLPLRWQTTPAGPPGEFLVRGPENYRREALGRVVTLVYYTAAELERALPDDDSGLRVA